MTFTISALEAEDHKCQGRSVCGVVSHSGDNICFGNHCPPDILTAASGKTPPLPSPAFPFPVVNMAFSDQGDSFLTQQMICLCYKMVKFDRFSPSDLKCYDEP